MQTAEYSIKGIFHSIKPDDSTIILKKAILYDSIDFKKHDIKENAIIDIKKISCLETCKDYLEGIKTNSFKLDREIEMKPNVITRKLEVILNLTQKFELPKSKDEDDAEWDDPELYSTF